MCYMLTSPEEPYNIVTRLRDPDTKIQGILTGHYRVSGEHVSIIYSVLVSVSCPKALYHLELDNLFRNTLIVADWLGPYHRSSSVLYRLAYFKIQTYLLLELIVCMVGIT